ncbi:GNAT family N-acetyltransferase [Poseidonocella sp. HB161398]|uniref:GNAT family N-acetyltransferase n=1 Tax=Poseidonocella sp. HB161398 TaxID=2320855 RepID=UPI001109EFF3|nr:GNAT family N-acetyltransferase [Poseidonocella sp. HB161398]
MQALPPPREIRATDGTAYRLRPIRPGDAASLIRGFEAMPPRNRWFRLLHPVPHLTEEMAEAYCSPDPAHEICLVVEGRGALEGDILGGARIADLAPGKPAEFAVSLRPEAEGMGLARQSLEAVIAIARLRGATGVWGSISGDNSWMLGLAKRLGMSLSLDPEDFSLRLATLDFGPPDEEG